MKKGTIQRKLPTFVNIDGIKETPRDPVIPYFTKAR
jgi:hypothetical protein